MSKEQELAFEVFIEEYYKPRKTFSLNEVRERLMEVAGTTRIAPARLIDDWIKSALIRGELEEVEPFVYKWNI